MSLNFSINESVLPTPSSSSPSPLTDATTSSSSSSCIRSLAPQTVRALSSSLTIVDPVAAVKELVDNALDAGATSIAVEVSANGALDHVTVRDNGRSVPPTGDDRQLLGRRHCTSKLREYGELLRDVGGRSLGFRGEALASLAEVCQRVEVTVKCEGETMGEVLRLGREGPEGVVEVRKIGCPVGTTVRAEGFFDRWPVRKQAALREAQKGSGVTKKIRAVLQAYALARPGCRLSLKVVKGTTKKGKEERWTYAPKPGLGRNDGEESIMDAVWKIIGKDAAAQCNYVARNIKGYGFGAVLPKVDAESKNISGLGQFLSVDARPVSTARGTLKLLSKAFRDKLKKANPTLEDVKEPFLRMDIACPPGSYDPNVEPSKSDLLFDDPASLIAAVNELLDAFYSSTSAEGKPSEETPETHESETSAQAKVKKPEDAITTPASEIQTSEYDTAVDDDLFDQLVDMPTSDIAHTPASPNLPTSPPHNRAEMSNFEEPQRKRQRTWKYNMYDFDNDDLIMADAETQEGPDVDLTSEDTEEGVSSVTLSNPWTMAKMNARIRNPGMANHPHIAHTRKQSPEPQLGPSTSTPTVPRVQLDRTHLPTPQASSPAHCQNSVIVRSGGPGGLNLTRSQATPSAGRSVSKPNNSHLLSPHSSFPQVDAEGFVPVSPQPTGGVTGNLANTAASNKPRRGAPRKQQSGHGGINKPFKSPINAERDSWFSNLPSKYPKRSTVFLRNKKTPTTSGDDAANDFMMSGAADSCGLSDGRDRDIRHWTASGTRRERISPSDNEVGALGSGLPVGHNTEASEEVRQVVRHRSPASLDGVGMRNFELSAAPMSSQPSLMGATAGTLTLQNRPAAISQQNEAEELPQQETAETVIVGQPLRRSLRRRPAAKSTSTTGRALNVVSEHTQQPRTQPEQSGQQQHTRTTGLVSLRRHSTRQQARCRTTSNLPLESVPDGARMQNISLVVSTAAGIAKDDNGGEVSAVHLIKRITTACMLLSLKDEAISWGASGEMRSLFAVSGEEVSSPTVVQSWADRLGSLLMQVKLVDAEEDTRVRGDLSFVLMQAVERHKHEVLAKIA